MHSLLYIKLFWLLESIYHGSYMDLVFSFLLTFVEFKYYLLVHYKKI